LIRSIADLISSAARSSLGPSVLVSPFVKVEMGFAVVKEGEAGGGEGDVEEAIGKARVMIASRPSESWAEFAGRSGVGGRDRTIVRSWFRRDIISCGVWSERVLER